MLKDHCAVEHANRLQLVPTFCFGAVDGTVHVCSTWGWPARRNTASNNPAAQTYVSVMAVVHLRLRLQGLMPSVA